LRFKLLVNLLIQNSELIILGEGRRKKEEGRRKREEGRRKRETVDN